VDAGLSGGIKQAMWRRYFKSTAILEISQVKGSETPSVGSLSPCFIGGLCQGETKVKTGAGAPPVAALGIIGQVASRLPKRVRH